DALGKNASNLLAGIGLASGKITHVIYVIKENRTYDQVLGDLPQGNGDKSLLLFGRDVTPNQHALAERFVLLDNLYACGEVTGDNTNVGHPGVPDNLPAAPGLMPGGHDLAGITDIDYRRFDLDYCDSGAPEMYFKQTGDKKFLWDIASFGKYRAPSRFAEWN